MNYMKNIRSLAYNTLRKLEFYTKTDMIYLASGGFWLNLNFVISSGFAFILSISLAYFVPKEVYGTYQYLLSLSAIFTAFSLTGINSAITQSVARGYEGSLVDTIKPQLKWGLLSSLAAFTTAGYYFYHSSTILGLSLIVIGIFLPIINTTNTYTAFYIGRKDFKKNFIYSNFFNFIYTIVLTITVILTKNPLLIILSYFITNSIINTFLFIYTIKTSKINDRIDSDTIPYAKHLSLMSVISVVANKIDGIMVFQFLGPTSLALYTFAKIVPEKIGGAFKSVASIAFPKFSTKEKHEINSNLLYRTALFAIVTLIASGIYILIAPILFNTFFPKYIESIPYSQVFSLSLIGAAASLPNYALMSQKLKRELYIISTVNPILQLIILTIMLYFWGIWGLIYSKIISSFIYLLVSVYLAHTETKKPSLV